MAEPEIIETVETETQEITIHQVPPSRPRKVYAGMWGPLEISVISAAALILLTVIMVFAFWVIPSNRELARNKSEADRLDAERQSANSKYGDIRDSQTQVNKLVASVDDFETRFLPLPANGQSALYQRLNGLILSYGLTNTSGPDYAPLETVDRNQNQQSEEERGRGKFRSLYPGVYVTTTVEGTYQNLRRFIRDIETGNEFVVISAIELAPSDTQKNETRPNQQVNPNQAGVKLPGANTKIAGNQRPGVNPGGFNQNPMFQQPVAQPSKNKGKTHGDVVSLHIEMAAYFRRPNFVPLAGQQ